MRKVVMFLLIIVLSLTLVACNSQEGVVTQEKLDTLEEGMTKDDVKELFGEPLEIDGEQWIYDFIKDDKTLTLRVFFFDDELAGSYTGPKRD